MSNNEWRNDRNRSWDNDRNQWRDDDRFGGYGADRNRERGSEWGRGQEWAGDRDGRTWSSAERRPQRGTDSDMRSRSDAGAYGYYRGDDYRNQGDYGPRVGSSFRGADEYGARYGQRDNRDFFDRATDEMSSWFGDSDAERRRERDAREGDAGAQHHVGRGPKGYTRSDERIKEDVSDRLTDDRYVDASDIEVSVSGREVTLSGTVGHRDAKRRAEDIAERVSGVTHVSNNLRVQNRSQTSWGSTSAAGTGATVTDSSTSATLKRS